jgi:hypothetical protein
MDRCPDASLNNTHQAELLCYQALLAPTMARDLGSVFATLTGQAPIRLVVHADVPGSLENYLQETGRVGRDQDQARCVLLYDAQDIETQLGMSEGSKLTLNRPGSASHSMTAFGRLLPVTTGVYRPKTAPCNGAAGLIVSESVTNVKLMAGM